MSELVYKKESVVDLYVYDDKLEIKQDKSKGTANNAILKAFNYADVQTYYYKDITSVDYKPITFVDLGWIGINVPGTYKDIKFKYGDVLISKAKKQQLDKEYKEVFEYIKSRIQEIKASDNQATPKIDVAIEIRKFKELLDEGIITQEEFDKKKTQLLDL